MTSEEGSSKSIKSTNITAFLKAAANAIGDEAVFTNTEQIAKRTQTSLGYSKSSPAILLPKNVSEIHQIVQLANQTKTHLYPTSRGRNIGYGDSSPVRNRQVIVSLERMKQIREYNPDAGEVIVEPGVTQKDLADFLLQQGDIWISDATGAPSDASVVGNFLEGGFGHTPLGNHRKHILEVEAVLGSGRFLKTGRFPDLGPDLSPLFVQSNFGIVTALRIPLFRRPEQITTFTIQFKDDRTLLNAIPIIRELRQLGLIQSLLHVGNATRIFMSTQPYPDSVSKDVVLTDEDLMAFMKTAFYKPTKWVGVGGLYGSKLQVQLSTQMLRKALSHLGRLEFFTDGKFAFF